MVRPDLFVGAGRNRTARRKPAVAPGNGELTLYRSVNRRMEAAPTLCPSLNCHENQFATSRNPATGSPVGQYSRPR